MKQLPLIWFIRTTCNLELLPVEPWLSDEPWLSAEPFLIARLATGSSVAGFRILVSFTSDTTPLLEYDDTSKRRLVYGKNETFNCPLRP